MGCPYRECTKDNICEDCRLDIEIAYRFSKERKQYG